MLVLPVSVCRMVLSGTCLLGQEHPTIHPQVINALAKSEMSLLGEWQQGRTMEEGSLAFVLLKRDSAV